MLTSEQASTWSDETLEWWNEYALVIDHFFHLLYVYRQVFGCPQTSAQDNDENNEFDDILKKSRFDFILHSFNDTADPSEDGLSGD